LKKNDDMKQYLYDAFTELEELYDIISPDCKAILIQHLRNVPRKSPGFFHTRERHYKMSNYLDGDLLPHYNEEVGYEGPR
jgi:hypothetical protein